MTPTQAFTAPSELMAAILVVVKSLDVEGLTILIALKPVRDRVGFMLCDSWREPTLERGRFMLVLCPHVFTYLQLLESGVSPTAERFAPLFGCGDSGLDQKGASYYCPMALLSKYTFLKVETKSKNVREIYRNRLEFC